MPEPRPSPPEALRVMVGPFAAADTLFRASGEQTLDAIVAESAA
jgi:hypothetical protein